jgi:RHH-type transcriptional regulator, proline utilization regulon repressor / proline dehydrogenase / delta 1-pyrroline-5-carboxylate dehydrogenase
MLFTDHLQPVSPTREKLRSFYRKNEEELIKLLLPIADTGSAARSRAWERARKLVVEIRRQQVGKGGIDALLNEFALSTEEGVVLMCLAEALLRVPDRLTMDRLIQDKLSAGDWSAHLGNSESMFVNASAWGLLLTGKVLNYRDKDRQLQLGVLKKTIGRMGEPVIRASVRYAMQIMGTQFVMGTTIQSAVERAREAEERGYRFSYDMLGEGARTMADADRHFESYLSAIEVIGRASAGRGPVESPGISIKLSAIHPRYEYSHRARVMTELVPRLKTLAMAAKGWDIGFTVDAEEADRLELSLDIIERVFSDPNLKDWQGFGIAVQAYQRRGLLVIEWARELTLTVGRRMMIRLVKGAYWDSEIKIGQVEGHDSFPVFTRKTATDLSYHACARKLLEYRDTIYPQFATHNAYTVASILEMDSDRSAYEFQRLHGMGEALFDQVVQADNVPCRIYAPVGVHADLLAYLVRRLLENGANSSFVNNIVDDNIPVESLLDDPVEMVSNWRQKSNPVIPAPENIFGRERRNSGGMDLTDPLLLEAAKLAMDNWLEQLPLGSTQGDNTLEIRSPSDRSLLVGTVALADEAALQQALARTHDAFPGWASLAAGERATILEKLADALQLNAFELIALCTSEAGKTIADGVAEVREAIDFCRYYAAQAVAADFNAQELAPRGVALCISPWNFPLAIFLGQVAAALAVGNTVVAKPAEQTSLVALRAAQLLAGCGLPEGVLEVVVAHGPVVGDTLVPDERVQLVMFTGSTETGSWIARRLAQRNDAPIPLIAETGGQNCMIVDSTALPEQVVDDVIASGFQSAGQRCSALRVLFLQADIADKVIDMIIGGMRELHVGDPALLATDIGPVIDDKALQRLQEHVAYLDSAGRLLHCCDAPAAGNHSFFAPRLYEISNLSLLQREVFGPVVHIIRYEAHELEHVIEQINATGYGLTFGVHSRIERTTAALAQQINAGNVYINRNMIGAVVGVQPFGGHGLSGTGPKAGGPNYLYRLVSSTPEQHNAPLQLALPVESDANPVADLEQCAIAGKIWRATTLGDKLSVLRQYIANYATATTGEHHIEHTIKAARDQLLFAQATLSEPIELPGPTGESNHLLLEPRGLLLLSIDLTEHNEEYLLAVLSALAAGNTVTLFTIDPLLQTWHSAVARLEDAGLPPKAVTVLPHGAMSGAIAWPQTAGIMMHAQSVYLHDVARVSAERGGAILPLISSVSPQMLLRQTLLEKTISIDTTAAGGNASLMTMSP